MNLYKNQKGYTLPFILFITILVVSLLFGLITILFFLNNIESRKINKKSLDLACYSAVQKIIASTENDSYREEDLLIGNEIVVISDDTVQVEKKLKGLFFEVTAFTRDSKDSSKVKYLLGYHNFFPSNTALTISRQGVGPTGTGKTHLAKALGHSACRNYMSVGSYNFHELFTLLSQADLSNKLSKQLNSIIKADLLIIDDFAFRKIDQKSVEYLYAITDARYGKGSVILTSNRSMSDWGNIFPDPVMANVLMDRLCHNAHQIIIKGESYRKKKSQEAEKI